MRFFTTLALLVVVCASDIAAQLVVTYEAQEAAVKQQLSSGAAQLTIPDYPVSATETATLQLRRRRSAVDATTQWIVPTSIGDKQVQGPDLTLYSGEIVGIAGSKVWLVYTAQTNQVYSVVQQKDATSTIQLPPQSAFNCTTSEIIPEHITRRAKDMTPLLLANKPLLQVDVAVETDVEFFKATGSTLLKAQAYTAALYSVVSAIYEDEVRVSVYLPWVKTWTDAPADPYAAKGDPFVLRDAAVPYWKNNYQAVQRDVYHVLTSTSFGSGGFGYYDALCSKNGDYGMSAVSVQGYNALPTFAFTYDVYIVAHELGHNFNAAHTHSCFWNPPIDTCVVDEGINGSCLSPSQQPKPNPGSIMSYCGGTNLSNGLGYQLRMTLLPQVAAVMRATAEAAECLTAPPPTTLVLLNPHGEESLPSGIGIDLRWRARTCEATVSTQTSGVLELSVCDVRGKCILKISGAYSDAGTRTFSFDVAELTTGAYFVVAKCGDAQASRALIIP